MHIAVVSHSDPTRGGSCQYSLALVAALAALRLERDNIKCTLLARSDRELAYLHGYWTGWGQVRLPFFRKERLMDLVKASVGDGLIRDALRNAAYRFSPGRLLDPDRIWSNGPSRRLMERYAVDWVLYTTPTTQAFESGFPYVMPVYDLQHRLQPEFREVSAHGEWERREYLYRNGARHATLILADSEVGKEDILEYYSSYRVTPDRVKVLPYRPAPYLSADVSDEERRRVRETYRLPERYFFYPAQLWPHKNHMRIVQAIGRLKEDKKSEIHLVLCGTHSGAIRTQVFRGLMSEAHRLRIDRQIHYLGYVPNEVMSGLYAEAAALVMPTFFGPTNIPIVEAWLFGCPVLTSDIRGIREQVGNAGLLVEPRSLEAIAEGMDRLWQHEGLRAELAQRGLQRLASQSRENYCAKLREIISEANLRVGKQMSPQDRVMV